MRCANCQAKSFDDGRFCTNCGAALFLVCPECGLPSRIPTGQCENCSHPLTAATNLAVPLFARPPRGDLKPLTNQLHRLDVLFEGERKHITVLFADIVDSSRLVAGLDHEDAHDRLLPPLETMMAAVRRYGGMVNQVLGDGIMALFGAPVAQEDHAVKACLAAVAMQNDLRHAASGSQSSDHGAIRIRVGLSSGGVVVRAIENDIHIDYRAIGETVYMAARLESCAAPGRIALAAETLRLADRYVEANPIECVTLKGEPQSVEAFELTRVTYHRGPPAFQRERVLPRFVGRMPETNILRRALDRAMSGDGQAVAMVGEPGVGKSRLFHEFLQGRRDDDGWTFFRCSLVSHDQVSASRPLAELVKTLLNIRNPDGERQIRVKVARKLATLGFLPDHFRPALLMLLGVASENEDWQALDPPDRHRHTLEAVAGLLARESLARPIVAVFEDLHHIDSVTQALLDTVIGQLSSTRILLLLNYRPEYRHDWIGIDNFSEHRIEPLSPDNAAEFLTGYLGNDSTLDSLKRRLIDRTEGVPFFLEECVRALVESGALDGRCSAYRLVAATPTLDVPATVQSVLAARIDRLQPADKRLLLTAAVIGKNVNVALFRDIADVPNRTFHASLDRLQAAEFLEPMRLFPETELTFRHALTHEVAYGTLLRARRHALHGRIVSEIESRYADRLDDRIERLAHHAVEGELWEKALTHCRQAGSKALAKSVNREAADFFENALRAGEKLPQTREHTEKLIDIALDLARSLFALGRYDESHNTLVKAQDLANQLGDERRLANVASLEALYHWISGGIPAAVHAGKAALRFAKQLDDLVLEIPSAVRLGVFLVDQGDYGAACELLEATRARIPDDAIYDRVDLLAIESVACLATFARSLGELGRFEQAIRAGDESIRIADEVGHAFSQILARLYVGHVFSRQGDFERSLPLLERSFALCTETQLTWLIPPCASSLGYAYVRAQRIGQGMRLLEEADRAADKQTLVLRRSLQSTWFGEAYLLAGRIDQAHDYASNALALAKENGEKGHEGWALQLVGEIHSSLNGTSGGQAEKYFCKALAIAEARHMGPLTAHCRLGLAKLYRRSGDWDRARRDFDAAMFSYRDLEMGYWLKRAESQFHSDEALPRLVVR